MVFKRTVKELIDLVGVRYLEYYLTNDYSDYPDHLYKPETYTLDGIIEGDYLYISLHGHDDEYILYSFVEDQLENELEHLKSLLIISSLMINGLSIRIKCCIGQNSMKKRKNMN